METVVVSSEAPIRYRLHVLNGRRYRFHVLIDGVAYDPRRPIFIDNGEHKIEVVDGPTPFDKYENSPKSAMNGCVITSTTAGKFDTGGNSNADITYEVDHARFGTSLSPEEKMARENPRISKGDKKRRGMKKREQWKR